MRPDLRQRLLADLALVAITLIWGATFVVVKEALDSVSTLLFLALRFSLATVALGLLFGRRLFAEPRPRHALRAGLLVGASLFLGYLFQTLGLRSTTPARSAFITGLSMVLVPLYAALFDRVRPSANSWAGVATATLGLYLLASPGSGGRIAIGDLLTVGCAAAFGLHVVLLGRLAARTSVAFLAFTQVTATAAFSLATFSWAETPYIHWSSSLLVALGITGLLATALAFSIQTWAQRFTSPTHTALIFALEPVFAAVTSYLVLGESLRGAGLAGAALILAGIPLSELGPS